jgi:hypothetical protein
MSRRARALAIGLSIAFVVACSAGLGYVKYTRVTSHLKSLRGHLGAMEAISGEELLSAAQTGNLATVRMELVGTRDDLVSIKAELSPFLHFAPIFGWVPVVGGDIAAGPELLEAGIGIATAADSLFEGLGPLLSLAGGAPDTQSNSSSMEMLTMALAEGRPHFELARAEIERIQTLREGLSEERLSPEVSGLLTRLDRYLPVLDAGVEALLIAPSLLGADEPRAYLLLAQNEQELRATGGFISSVALLRLSGGRIVELDFRDSYAVDDLSQPHPAAPGALEEHMLAQIWVLRDSNWYPDFPTSAQAARDLYSLDQGVLVDGVVAADLTATQLLVECMEPLELDGYEEEVTGSNVVQLMQLYWSSPSGEGQTGDWWVHRKDFMGDLLSAMMATAQRDIASIDLAQLVAALQRSLKEKHMLVYIVDPELSARLRESGWDGSLTAYEGDYLMVLDSNMGFNKVNASVQAGVGYWVTIEDEDTALARLSVAYDNVSRVEVEQCVQEAAYPPTYRQMMEGCYWDYLRVYTPEGTRLIQGPELTLPEGSLRARESGAGGTRTPTSVVPSEAGKNVFSSFFVVAPGEYREMVYQYELPSRVLAERESALAYRLLVQKQAGTLALPLRVEVQLPPGSTVLSTSPEASSVADGLVAFSSDLRVDREFEVVFR